MDRITKSFLDEFISQNSLSSLPEDTAFEHFSGYLVVSGHYSETFPTEDISVGAGGDCGIDCIAIIANGALISDPKEIADYASTNGYLDATFLFVQAERSSSFDTAKIGQFGFGVCDFFKETPQLPRNDKMKMNGKIWQAIFERSKLFKKGNPQCFMYYVTTGKWTNDQNLIVRRDAIKKDVEDLNLFRRVVFECIDAERLQKLYRESQNAVAVEITFSDRTVMPDIPKVEQAFLGLLPATEFLKLVENDSYEMQNALFNDNVRHWQEWNPVNKEIKETLSKAEDKVLFPLLNNGVTVVARRINQTANRFTIEDYQVVNGCQTSFVLHESRDNLDEHVMVPIRLIATKDEGVKNAIIKATNRQTEVTDQQLCALSDFPKHLEAYFPTYEGNKKLFYERRSRQYNSIGEIDKVRVVNMTMLVRAFASMFLKLPHQTTRNYSGLMKKIGNEIFNKEHRFEPYYVSAYAHFRLEFLFRKQTIDSKLKSARYHLLMAYRMLSRPDEPPRMNSHDMEKYCLSICESLWDDTLSKDRFLAAGNLVMEASGGNLDIDNIRTVSFTDSLLSLLPTNP